MALPAVGWAQGSSTLASASIDTRLSYSINSRLGGRDHPLWSSSVTPGFRLQSRSGRVVGSLDYGLVLASQTGRDKRSEVGNRLSANFDAEVYERRFFVQGNASISRQSTSAVGTRYDSSSGRELFDVTNSTEVASLSLSPSWRGVLGGAVNYELRLFTDATNARGSTTGDRTRNGGSATLSSAFGGTSLTWALNANRSQTEFRLGRASQSESANAQLGWMPDADLTLSLRGGSERQSNESAELRSSSTWGAGATWRPSPRTRLQLNYLDRYFGTSWSGAAEYRMRRAALNFSSSRDTTDGLGASFAPVSQLQAFMSLFADEIPDVEARETFVRALLASQEIDPNSIAVPAFVTTAISVAERHQLGLVLSGRRLSMSAQAYRSISRVIDTVLPELSREPVRQSGYTGSLSYRLAPRANVVVSGSRQMTAGSASRFGTDLKSLSLSYAYRPGQRTTLSLSTRYTVFNSPTDPYREASIQAALGHRF
jgi:uncharacterized protein (PEP-CTERM system associated)